MLKAICHSDLAFTLTGIPVFDFNESTGNFEHIDEDVELTHPFAVVMNDTSWQVYVVYGEFAYPIQNMERVQEDKIYGLLKG